MANVRNILLIGNAGKGKSTLANVLTETSEFKESASRVNGNDETKAKEFEHEGIKYRVIDTVGTGIFTKQTEAVLSKLEEKADVLSEGLHQILFVTNGRFTKEEAEAFDLLRNAIFDDHATDYTTIVCTNFPSFEDETACEKNRQDFQKEIEEFSKPLASTAAVYVDNPPLEGRYKLMAGDSRRASRKILLEHLKTCEGVYRPELLDKFRKMVEEFNSIIEDTVKETKNVDFHYSKYADFMGEFVAKRGGIIIRIEKHRDDVKKYMEDRFKSSIITHSFLLFGEGLAFSGALLFPPILVPGVSISALGWLGATGSDSFTIFKENEAYKSFEKNLDEDKERCDNLKILQENLSNSIRNFKKIRPRFESSKYKRQNIDRKRIEIIENVMNRILGEEIETDVELEKSMITKHSTVQKAARATIETICKLAPSPLSFYCMYRDHKEVKGRDSLNDIETAVESLRREIKVLDEKQLLLRRVYEKINLCKEEIEKLL